MSESVFKQFSSDEDLLNAQFKVQDPLNSVESLLSSKPDPEQSPTIIGYYDETPSGGRLAHPDEPYIWCCHCQKNTHWKGYVVEDHASNRYTIGNNCGHDHYGAAFESVERAFNEKIARRGVLRAFKRLSSKIEGLETEIEGILSCPVLKRHDSHLAEVSKKAPRAFKALKNAAQKGGLSAVKRVRNRSAEIERDERYRVAIARYRSLPYNERRQLRDEGLKPEREDDPIFDSVSVDFGAVFGTSLLRLSDPRSEALKARVAIQDFRRIQKSGTDGYASKVISQVRKDLFDATERLRSAMISVSFAETFFEADHLKRICEWSDCMRYFSIWQEDERVFVRDDDGEAVALGKIDMTELASAKILDRLHYTGIEDKLLEEGSAALEDPDDPTSRVLV